LFGNHDVVVSGNVGYGRSLSNAATAFRTTYSRETGVIGAPEVSVTVRQLQVPVVARRGLVDGREAPALQTLTLGFADRAKLTDGASIEYGFLYESVSYVNRFNFASPYARLVQELGPGRELHLRYASGAPQPRQATSQAPALRDQVSTLGMFPRLSLRDGRPTVQRTEHVEIAYREQLGDGLLEVGIYRDALSDTAVSAFVPAGHFADGNVLPDLFSRSSTLNAGDHQTTGYRISYARKLREHLEAALGYGSSGVLTPHQNALQTPSAQELRDSLETRRAHIITASLSAEVPRSRTRILSTYQWVSEAAVIAPDLYNDFTSRSEPGWNLIIRQPLPFDGPLPGKLEATADIRNLLGAGYIPMGTFDGQQMALLQAIRSYRGALSFVF
jgi:hypothetical protein